MNQHKYPSLYQINTRVWLTGLSKERGRDVTLDDIPDTELDRLASKGFDWIWLLSVWTTGEQGQCISRQNKEWRHEFELTLPDLKEEDIGGSGFAIADYHVHPKLGGDEALKRLRSKLNSRGLKLMLDFVPNHMGPDHSWVQDHPEYIVSGTEVDLKNTPQNYTRIGENIFAYGRDPYFPGWLDTVQLNYSNPAVAEAMKQELLRISFQCDGVRCDMAMLVLPEVFEKTWGRKAKSFWPEAIKAVRKQAPDFCFMAEVYWDMEWILQQQDFDYTYDKRLYDRLLEGNVKPVREHFYAGLEYQNKLVRFLENHDEPRAAGTFTVDQHKAVAIITYLAPGLRFFHQGQFEGRTKRISPHLIRGPHEPVNEELHSFYADLLSLIKRPLYKTSEWCLLECVPAWDGNESWNTFISFAWEGNDGKRSLVIVNYGPHSSQCYTRLPFSDLHNLSVDFKDQLSAAQYVRNGNDLLSRGMYFDLPAWGYHVFELVKITS